jgi:hypothetical protein
MTMNSDQNSCAEPDRAALRLALPGPDEKGRDHHVERRQESRISDRGFNDAGLLNISGSAERQPTQRRDGQDFPDAGLFRQCERCERHGRDGRTQGNEGERLDIVHRHLLEVERYAPDDGREQHHRIRRAALECDCHGDDALPPGSSMPRHRRRVVS